MGDLISQDLLDGSTRCKRMSSTADVRGESFLCKNDKQHQIDKR
jgi:hypothetical protein